MYIYIYVRRCLYACICIGLFVYICMLESLLCVCRVSLPMWEQRWPYWHTFVDEYCSTVQGLLDWFEVDLGFTELLFIHYCHIICICVQVCMFVNVCTSVCLYMCGRVCACICVYVCKFLYVCTCVCLYQCVRVRMFANFLHMYVSTYTHIHTHTRIHATPSQFEGICIAVWMSRVTHSNESHVNESCHTHDCVTNVWVTHGNTYCTLQHTATHCNTLQHTATHCNTLQHTATHCNNETNATHRNT